MRGNGKILAIVCVVIMCATAFGNVAAELGENQGSHVDVFTDPNGNQHKVWREKVDGVSQVFYANNIKDNNTGLGHGENQITNSISDVNYPQFSIDSISGHAYVTWIIYDLEEQFWYCGSPNLITWSVEWYGGIKDTSNGNPTLDMIAHDYLLDVTWKHGGSLVIEPDCDGDFINDKNDSLPFKYDHVFGIFNADAVSVDLELGISVAVDWKNDSKIKPVISQVMPSVLLVGSIVPYVQVTLPVGEFTVVIKYKYSSSTLSPYINEKYLRIYAYDDTWRMIGDVNGIIGGVDIDKGYVWAQTSELSILTIADASATDLDNDAIPDIWDPITTSGTAQDSGRMTIYSGDSLVPQIYISPDDVYHMAWIDKRDGSPSVYYKRSTDYGITWTTDERISASSLNIPSMSFSGDDKHLAVAYHRTYKTGAYILSSIVVLESIDAGITWNTLSLPQSAGVNPSVSVYQDKIYVVYEKIVPSGGDVPHVYLEGLRLGWTEDGTMTSETIVYTESHAQHLVPKISIENDEIHIAWAGYFDNGDDKIYYIHKGIGDIDWSSVEEVTTYYGENDPYAIAFVAKNDDLYLAWADNRNGQYDIYGKWMDSTSGLWSNDLRLTNTALNSICPDLYVSFDGVVRVVWQEGTDSASDIFYMKFNINPASSTNLIVGEQSISGDVGNDYTKTGLADNDYQTITEEFVMDYSNVDSENVNIGTLISGSLDDLYDSDNIYERYKPVLNADSVRELSIDWIIPVDLNSPDYTLVIEVRRFLYPLSAPNFYNIEYSNDDGATFMSLGTYDNRVDITYSFPLLASGFQEYIVNINFLGGGIANYLWVDRLQISIPTTKMELEHKWVMNLATPEATTHTFFMKAYQTSDTENDAFQFSYSLDNSNFINMFVLDKVTDDGAYLQYSLPANLATTVYIRVTDTIRVSNEDPDSLFVDHIYIDSTYDVIGTIIASTLISNNGALYSGNPVITLNSLGDVYVIWSDDTYGNYEVIAITDATATTIKTSPIIIILAQADNSIFTDETDYILSSSVNVQEFHRSTLISKLDTLTYMLSAEDNVAAYGLIEYNIKPYIESTIVDEGTMNELLTSISAIGDPITPLGSILIPPGTPSTIEAISLISGSIQITWGAPTSGGSVTGYKLYRTTYNLNPTGVAGWTLWIDNYNSGTSNPYNIVHFQFGAATLGTSNTGLTPGVTYYYAIAAYNTYGESGPQIYSVNEGVNYATPVAPPPTPTQVTSVSPSSGATGISRDTYIDIYFNKPMDLASVTSRFTLTLSGATISCLPSQPSPSHVRFDPPTLGYGLIYLATLASGAVASSDSVATTSITQWTFTIVADPTFPYVSSSSPNGDQINIPSAIIITFSEPMYTVSASAAFSLTGFYSGIVSGTKVWTGGNTILTFTPSSALTGGNVYTISVLKSAQRADKIKSMNADYTAQFRTPLTITAVLTATSEEFLLSWLEISNPITTNPYEVFYSSTGSSWEIVSTTSSTSYVMDAIAWDCQPHTTQLFKVKAYNTAGCNGESAVVSAECGRVDYYLNVGAVDANVYHERDMPFTLDDMPRYGLTLPPQSTGLHLGWSAIVPGTGSEPDNWRQGMQGYQQMFLFNLGHGAELHIDYLLTFHYRATARVTLEQKVGPDTWIPMEEIVGSNTWETAYIWINHNDYYDHSDAGNWWGTNILFRFSNINVIYIDWIKAEPHAFFADVLKNDFDVISNHSPGVSLHEGDWMLSADGESRYGNANSKFYVNLPYSNDKLSLIITYKSEGGALWQSKVGLDIIKIGVLPTSTVDWHTTIIQISRTSLIDQDSINSFINVNFMFDCNIFIQSICLRIYREWFTLPEWAPVDQLIMTLPTGTEEYLWPVYVEIIKEASGHIQTIELNICGSDTEDEFRDYYYTSTSNTILPTNVIFRDNNIQNIWVRDYGPGFVFNFDGTRGVTDWLYRSSRYIDYVSYDEFLASQGIGNAIGDESYPRTYYNQNSGIFSDYINCGNYPLHGGNWQTDGNGFGYTSKKTPEYTQVELMLRYGVKDVRVLLPLPQYDKTGHIDMYVYIASSNTVIIARFPEEITNNGEFDTNYEVTEDAVNKFISWGFTNVLRVDTPNMGVGDNGDAFVYSYTNSLVMNNLVLIPSYVGVGWNNQAKGVFETAFPGKIVKQIDSSAIIQKLGAVHCITLTRPAVP